jgi:formamidase
MKSFSTDSRNKLVFRSAIIGIALAGCVGGPMIAEVVAADAPDATVLLERSGAYCRDDPNCFNRLHPEMPTVARARPEQVIVFETRDAADSSILPPEQTPPRSPGVIGHVIHPLTGPVHIEGG